jgi:hypothetical protein
MAQTKSRRAVLFHGVAVSRLSHIGGEAAIFAGVGSSPPEAAEVRMEHVAVAVEAGANEAGQDNSRGDDEDGCAGVAELVRVNERTYIGAEHEQDPQRQRDGKRPIEEVRYTIIAGFG